MPSLYDAFDGAVSALRDHYGSPPATTETSASLEDILAAFLARSLDQVKVSRVLAALRESGLIEPEDLARADETDLEQTLGAFKTILSPKLRKLLQRLARWYSERQESLPRATTDMLRDELTALNGVGPAAADAILLRGLGRPTYSVDRATYRILRRHGWIDPDSGYDEAREVIEQAAEDDSATLARLSTWLENVGDDFCRPKVARCEQCPLRPFLPTGGPREPDA